MGITAANDERSGSSADRRRMVRAELMGRHTHVTLCGVRVHIWSRCGKYIARGFHEKQRYGETLGGNEAEATARLRQLLTEIEDGSFLRPTETHQRPLLRGKIPRLTLRQLINEYLVEVRRLRGKNTCDAYRTRLMPVLDFAEQIKIRKKWPLAMDIDREFAVSLRSFLHQYQTTRNGRPGGTPKILSERQIHNILVCLRTMLSWARRPDVRKLPIDFANPLTRDLVGTRPKKDPLREDKLPVEQRVQIVAHMDTWQLCQLSLSLVLPLRPDEATGLLISDVCFEKGWLRFGTRLEGGDFNKGRQDFVLPFPSELTSILRTCIGDRTEGPLLRDRKSFSGRRKRPPVSFAELPQLYRERRQKAPRDEIQSEQDGKRVFRDLLRELGGVSEDMIAVEFKKLLGRCGLAEGRSLVTLRHSVSTAMERTPGMPHLALRYLTSHSTQDILNEYVALEPVKAMQLYFDTIRPLLEAIMQRARALGIPIDPADRTCPGEN